MSLALMLDTSFLISLVDPSRPHHLTAKRYYQYCLQVGVPLHVSTLALAEFATKQAVTDLPLGSLRIEPFNFRHAIECGRLWATVMPQRDVGDARAAVKADIQMLAQASAEGIPGILAEDANTLSKYAQRATQAQLLSCRVILLASGFDEALFNNGQSVLPLSPPA